MRTNLVLAYCNARTLVIMNGGALVVRLGWLFWLKWNILVVPFLFYLSSNSRKWINIITVQGFYFRCLLCYLNHSDIHVVFLGWLFYRLNNNETIWKYFRFFFLSLFFFFYLIKCSTNVILKIKINWIYSPPRKLI